MAMNVRKILVPVKGDESGEDAFRLACELSRDTKARLYALYVIGVRQELPLDAEVDTTQGEAILNRIEAMSQELPLDAEVDTTQGEAILNRIEAMSQEEKCPVEAAYLQARRAGPAIVQEALERGIDLIVLGAPYKQRFGQFTLGGTTLFVLKNAPCPVILRREQIGVASQSNLALLRGGVTGS
jgi:nucleotide-binding universal stress UspA family protein